MKVKSFTLYEEYYELITLLSEEEQAKLLLAITKYMFEDIEPVLNEKQTKIFNNLKRPLAKSKEQSKRRTSKEPNENQKETNKEPKGKPKENTSNDVNVNVNNLESNKRVIGRKEKTFKKPTPEEIHQYCLERNNFVNWQQFYDFYESKDWYVGKNKMKDWKACVRTWESRTPKQETIPEWFNKELKNEAMTEEDKEEMADLLNDIEKTINKI